MPVSNPAWLVMKGNIRVVIGIAGVFMEAEYSKAECLTASNSVVIFWFCFSDIKLWMPITTSVPKSAGVAKEDVVC